MAFKIAIIMVVVRIEQILENLKVTAVDASKVADLRRRKCLWGTARVEEASSWLGETYYPEAFGLTWASLPSNAKSSFKRLVKNFLNSEKEEFSFGEKRSIRKRARLDVSYDEDQGQGMQMTMSERNEDFQKRISELEKENMELKQKQEKLKSFFGGLNKSTRVSDSGAAFGSKKIFGTDTNLAIQRLLEAGLSGSMISKSFEVFSEATSDCFDGDVVTPSARYCQNQRVDLESLAKLQRTFHMIKKPLKVNT